MHIFKSPCASTDFVIFSKVTKAAVLLVAAATLVMQTVFQAADVVGGIIRQKQCHNANSVNFQRINGHASKPKVNVKI
jgi:hypothetical protein